MNMTSPGSQLLRLVLCAAAVYGLSGCTSPEAEKAQFVELARESSQAGDFAAALIHYKNALQIDPNDATVHWELAKSFEALGRYQDAYWEFEEAARLRPDDRETRQAAANYALIALRWEMALAHTDAIVALDPGASEAHVSRGIALERLKRMEEAEAAYLRAVETLAATDDGTAIGAVGAFYVRREERGKAAEYFERWVREVPSFDSLTQLARFQLADPSLDESTQAALEVALENAEGAQVALGVGNLFQLHASRGRDHQAERVLLTAIQQHTDRAIQLPLHFELARFRAARGDVNAGIEILERAAQAHPDEVRAQLVLSSYRELTGDLGGALATAIKVLEDHPDSLEARR